MIIHKYSREREPLICNPYWDRKRLHIQKDYIQGGYYKLLFISSNKFKIHALIRIQDIHNEKYALLAKQSVVECCFIYLIFCNNFRADAMKLHLVTNEYNSDKVVFIEGEQDTKKSKLMEKSCILHLGRVFRNFSMVAKLLKK